MKIFPWKSKKEKEEARLARAERDRLYDESMLEFRKATDAAKVFEQSKKLFDEKREELIRIVPFIFGVIARDYKRLSEAERNLKVKEAIELALKIDIEILDSAKRISGL